MNMEKVVIFRAWKEAGFWTVQLGKKEEFQIGKNCDFKDVKEAIKYTEKLRYSTSKNMLFIGESDKKPFKLPK